MKEEPGLEQVEPDVDESQKASWSLPVGFNDAFTRAKGTKKSTALFDFTNIEAIKERVKNAKKKSKPVVYNVHNAYHKTGHFQRIAKHQLFENCTLGVIVLNAFWISVDTDGNTADTMNTAKAEFVIMDTLFFTYFTIEVLIRFVAFEKKRDCLKDGWFKFDTILVILYAFDPFTLALMAKANGGSSLSLPTAVLRLCRLARLSRLVRMLRSLPELMVMIKGMLAAVSSVGYTMGLLIIITYVFAIAMRNLVPNMSEEQCADGRFPNSEGCIKDVFFSSVPDAMHNLIIFCTFLDNLKNYMWPVKEQSIPIFILSWIYVALASMTVMNMLIGVLCEVISAVAAEETESMMVDKVHEKFGAIVEKLDDANNNDGTICWDEFKDMLEMPEALAALKSVNVNPESMIDVAEDVFFEDGEMVAVPFDDFMGMVLDLRGGQRATVENVFGLGKRFTQKFMKVGERMEALDQTTDLVTTRMDHMDGKLDKILRHLKADVPVNKVSLPGAISD